MYEARVILDSVAPNGRRLTTMLWTYPRFIHAEFMTHRDRARNAASSRAIPFETMLRNVTEDPVVPLRWQQEAGGMQGAGDVPEALRPLALAIWNEARKDAARHATALRNLEDTARAVDARVKLEGDPGARKMVAYGDSYGLGFEELLAIRDFVKDKSGAFDDGTRVKVHKTIPNRLVEPWMWITVVTTATEWRNLWRLRVHPDAEVHFQKIAGMAKEAYEASAPAERTLHLPFVDGYDELELREKLDSQCNATPDPFYNFSVDEALCRISTARCARVSYLTHEGKRDYMKDVQLFERLVQGSGFGHWSPHEHPALAHPDADHRSGPYRGWQQFRKMFAGRECADA